MFSAIVGVGFLAASMTAVLGNETVVLTAPCSQWAQMVSSPFGTREDPVTSGQEEFHKGLDIAVAEGTPVYAAAKGQVILAEESETGYGFHLQIKHEKGLETLYAHCSQLEVEEGDWVKAGQEIAKSGATGEVTGAHLHFEVRENGKCVDPQWYLKGS
ncbi:MAG: M23 family metallopeptidase [Massiliimalia sp.]